MEIKLRITLKASNLLIPLNARNGKTPGAKPAPGAPVSRRATASRPPAYGVFALFNRHPVCPESSRIFSMLLAGILCPAKSIHSMRTA